MDRDPNTVFVTGAVIRPTLIQYRRGLSVRDYVELAGGPTDIGDEGKAIIRSPSGLSQRVRKVAFFFHTSPSVESGATITVPVRPESNVSTSEVWQRVLASATALASLVLAYAAITR